MKLYGRSHPDPKTLQWWSTLRVMDPMGVKGRKGSKVPCKVHGFKGLISRRSQQISKVLGRQGSPCEVHGFKGIICLSLKSFKGYRASGVKG